MMMPMDGASLSWGDRGVCTADVISSEDDCPPEPCSMITMTRSCFIAAYDSKVRHDGDGMDQRIPPSEGVPEPRSSIPPLVFTFARWNVMGLSCRLSMVA